MMPGSLARRYARALMGLAKSSPQRDRFAKDLDAFVELAKSRDSNDTSVLTILATERFASADRLKLLDTLCRRIGADPMVVKFLHHVLERGRFEGVPDIARAHRRMVDDAAGRINAEITSASPLPPDALAKVKAALEKATGKTVIATTTVDPELIGGVVAKVGSYIIDGSVRSALAQMKTALRR